MNRLHENLTLWHYNTFLGDLKFDLPKEHTYDPFYEFIPDADLLNNSNGYYSTIKRILFTNNQLPHLIRSHFNRGFQILQKSNKRGMDMSFPLKLKESQYQFLINRNFATYEDAALSEEFLFFYETKNCFSQWHKSEFEVNEILFSSAEQFMMHEKAMLFDDYDSAKKILSTNNPREQKAIGRTVKNFDQLTWERESIEAVYEGNKAKFIQNPHLLNELIETKGKTLVEASPSDIIWGIGLLENDENILDRKNWKGENKLGIVLTELREELRGNPYYNDYGLGYYTGKEFKAKYAPYKY